jgi:hypothetical protein
MLEASIPSIFAWIIFPYGQIFCSWGSKGTLLKKR